MPRQLPSPATSYSSVSNSNPGSPPFTSRVGSHQAMVTSYAPSRCGPLMDDTHGAFGAIGTPLGAFRTNTVRVTHPLTPPSPYWTWSDTVHVTPRSAWSVRK